MSKIDAFRYYENYQDLVRLELHCIKAVCGSQTLRNIAFVGSGPLPLSAICSLQALAQDHSNSAISCCCIDRSQKAIDLSSRLCLRLGYKSDAIGFQCIDIGDKRVCLRHFDVVHVAALVGVTEDEKYRLIKAVTSKMKQGALVVIRSAHSLRGLLYPVSNVFVIR